MNKLDEELDEESLYNIALSAEQKLAENSLTLTKLKVPTRLSDDIKISLEKIKGELSTGFKTLEKSMNHLAQYIVKRTPLLYDKFIENRDKGFLYIDGVLTSLTTIRLLFILHASISSLTWADIIRVRPTLGSIAIKKDLRFEDPFLLQYR